MGRKVRFAPTLFFYQNSVIRPLPCFSFSEKGHACCVCSLASALTTSPQRYQPFSVCRLRLERFCYSGDERNIVGRYIDGKAITL